MKEKEVALNNGIHRLKQEKGSQEATIVNLRKELEATKEKLHAAEENVRKLAKEESSTLEDLKKRLANTAETEREKEEELNAMNNSLRSLENQASSYQNENDRLQKHLTEQEAQLHAQHRENQELQSKVNEYLHAQATYSIERENMQAESSSLRYSLVKKEGEMQLARVDAAKKLKEFEDKSIADIKVLEIRVEEAAKAAADWKSKVQKIEFEKSTQKEEHKRELEEHKRQTEEKCQLLAQEVKAANEANSRNVEFRGLGQPGSSQQPATAAGASRDTTQKVSTGKLRKKVNRQNNSVLSIIGALSSQECPTSAQGEPLLQAQSSQFDEGADELDSLEPSTLAVEPPGFRKLDADGVVVLETPPEMVPDTQETLGLSFSQLEQDFTKAWGERERKSSSQLSEMHSEELSMLERENHAEPVKEPGHPDRQRLEGLSCSIRVAETPKKPSKACDGTPRSARSFSQPRSRANTASRIMPPPSSLPSVEQRPPGRRTYKPSTPSRSRGPISTGNGKGALESSPDYVHRVPSTQKTYGPHSEKDLSATATQRGTPRALCQSSSHSSHKRKSSEYYPETASSKRTRSSSHSIKPSSATPRRQRKGKGSSSTQTYIRGYRSAQGSQSP